MLTNFNLIIFFIFFNFLIIIFFSKIKFLHTNIDNPNISRKIHKKPTPLAGGIILFINILVFKIFLLFSELISLEKLIFEKNFFSTIFFLIFFLIFLIGFFDDKLNLNANLKFVLLSIVILILLFNQNELIIKSIKFSFYSKEIFLGKWSVFFTLFCILVYLNAFNMFDGINLQSGLYSLIVFIIINNYNNQILLSKILIIFLINFLYLNYKNKTFLGDSGTLSIAFIISFISIKFYNLDYIIYADQIVLLMLIPGLDLIRLTFLRIYQKRNPLVGDKLHIHHITISRLNHFWAIIIIITLISLPIILDFFKFNFLYNLGLSTLVYTLCLVFLRKN